MSTGHVVVDGAICKCQFGDVPDVLVVQSQQKGYINDNASKKLIANTMDLGSPFKAKTFGQCKLQPMGSSFKPCMPMVTQWQEFYDKVILSNQGQILTEKSKATCAIAGAPCIEFTWHGQTAEGGAGNTEEEADEDIQSQLNPLVNPNEEPFLTQELEGGSFDDAGKPIEKRKINVQIETIKTTFVPLGIPDFDGNEENEYLKFKIKISENPADKMKIEVFQDGESYYAEDISESSMLSLGEHEWQWDGFGDYGDYDSKSFVDNTIAIEVTVWLDGHEESHRITLEKKKSIKEDWVDISIQKNIKEIIVNLRVNLKDGGSKGLSNAHKIPILVKNHFKKTPLRDQTIGFETLKDLALEGIAKHWSRKIRIKGSEFDFKVRVVNTATKTMDDIKLVYNTNSRPLGSSNPGSISDLNSMFANIFVPEVIVMNFGYIKHKGEDPLGLDGWRFLEGTNTSDNFKYVAAHEIGHSLLKAYGGSSHSYAHKKSSTLLTQNPLKEEEGGYLYPEAPDEIDVMKYYNDDPYFYDFNRVFAQPEDIYGLIWLNKLKIK
ncbi:DUF4280 domain-containing protein [Cellulophaga sp. L1A9]|uniref:PAAR-like protein n=1 Tax=Cellulophaga sp. L1A9 TaxID=2686362 RepID=UPI00131BB13B